MLEVASYLVGERDWPYQQVDVRLRDQGDKDWKLRFFASDAPNSIDSVMSGEADFAICNPGGVLGMAVRGAGPYKQPLPLRSIMVLPQFDRMGFVVLAKTGLKSVADIAERRYPLKVSVRGQKDHAVHMITDQVLAVHGFSLEDILDWGGEVRYEEGTPTAARADPRLEPLERGAIDALFDEAMPRWGGRALELGAHFLTIDEPHLRELEAMGLRRVAIGKDEFPSLAEDVWTIDFSGWPVFTRADQPDHIVRAFCEGLEARKDRIPWYGEGPLRLDLLCKDSREGPLYIPLHPAAAAFWRKRGYLPKD
jgi:TRAP-type uncharacterized transport system substrate-binding protein